MVLTYIGELGNATDGSHTVPNVHLFQYLCIDPYGGQFSALSRVDGQHVRFSGVSTDGNVSSVYQVGFNITENTMTFIYNKSYNIGSGSVGTETKIPFRSVWGVKYS